MVKIIAPVEGLNGPGVGGLEFVDSVAETDNEAVIAYCRGAGYKVEDGEASVEPESVTLEVQSSVIGHSAETVEPAGDAVNAETGEVTAAGEPLPTIEQDEGTPLQPAGNASRDDWADYALATGATPEDIADLTRDQLRDHFGNREQA